MSRSVFNGRRQQERSRSAAGVNGFSSSDLQITRLCKDETSSDRWVCGKHTELNGQEAALCWLVIARGPRGHQVYFTDEKKGEVVCSTLSQVGIKVEMRARHSCFCHQPASKHRSQATHLPVCEQMVLLQITDTPVFHTDKTIYAEGANYTMLTQVYNFAQLFQSQPRQ